MTANQPTTRFATTAGGPGGPARGGQPPPRHVRGRRKEHRRPGAGDGAGQGQGALERVCEGGGGDVRMACWGGVGMG